MRLVFEPGGGYSQIARSDKPGFTMLDLFRALFVKSPSTALPGGLSYLVTISRDHLLPAQFLLRTLRPKTGCEIVAVGNLSGNESKIITDLGAYYLDERDIDVSGRMPAISWTEKYRNVGWYRQMFLRLSIDRFMTTEQVVILDSEVFAFDNWDERRFYTEDGMPKMFYWTPQSRKPDWDYRMYRGAAYPFQFLKGCSGVMEYANSDSFRRHISGVVLFSRRNVAHLWNRLENETDLAANMDRLFNHEDDLAFSDHDFYGIAVDLGLFENVVQTKPTPELLGWYDNHDDPAFHAFKHNAMWSMCQRYMNFRDPGAYAGFMEDMANRLGTRISMAEHPSAH